MHGRALFMCYPPPDSNMAELAVTKYTGDTLLYVGEWGGDTGTTALQEKLVRGWYLQEVCPLPNWGETCYELMVWKRASDRKHCTGNVLLNHGSPLQVVAEKGSVAGDERTHKRAAHRDWRATNGDNAGSSSNAGLCLRLLMPLGMHCMTCGVQGTPSSPLWRCRQTFCFAFCSDKCLQLALQSHSDCVSGRWSCKLLSQELCSTPVGAQKAAKVSLKARKGSVLSSASHDPASATSLACVEANPHPQAVRVGSYTSELRWRHCSMHASDFQLSDTRLYQRCMYGGGAAHGVQMRGLAACEEISGSTKKLKRKKKRKRQVE
jgi:hypothetical protein